MARDVVSLDQTCTYTGYRLWADGSVENTHNGAELTPIARGSRSDITASDRHIPTTYRRESWRCTPQGVNYLSDAKTLAAKIGPNGQVYWTSYRNGVIGTRRPNTINLYLGYYENQSWSPKFPGWVARQARAKVLEALVDSDVDLGQFLGELPSSLKSMAGNAITLLRAASAAKKGDVKGIAKALGVKRAKDVGGSAADVWFSYKFGWLPMMQDLHNMHSAVTKQMNKPEFLKVTRRHQIFEPAKYSTYGKTEGIQKYGCKIGVSYRVANSTLAGLNSLGLVNPLSVAWALMPLTFVWDWVLPIGSFLTQLSAPIGLQFVHGYETRYASGEAWVTEPVASHSGAMPKFHVIGKSFSRERLYTWPQPSLVLDFGLNPNQLSTLAGLLAQRAR